MIFRAARDSDLWFAAVKKTIHPIILAEHHGNKRVKVAVLDTGIALESNTPSFLKTYSKNIKLCRAFGGLDPGTVDEDESGHGTRMASLILKICPVADLYIARVARKSNELHPETVARAIRWAVDLDVDMINMSFGWALEHPAEVDTALMLAVSKSIRIFAATYNDGDESYRRNVPYPASSPYTFAIDSASGTGNYDPNNLSRTRDPQAGRFSAPGQSVLSACPTNVNRLGEMRSNGASVATAIATGVAALMLEFARQPPLNRNPRIEAKLKERGMSSVFSDLLCSSRYNSPFLTPFKLFEVMRGPNEKFGESAAGRDESVRLHVAMRISYCLEEHLPYKAPAGSEDESLKVDHRERSAQLERMDATHLEISFPAKSHTQEGTGSNNLHPAPCLYVSTMSANGLQELKVVQDTSTNDNWISAEVIESLGLPFTSTPQAFPSVGFDGKKFYPKGKVQLMLKGKGDQGYQVECIIRPENIPCDIIVGARFTQTYGHASTLFSSEPSETQLTGPTGEGVSSRVCCQEGVQVFRKRRKLT